MGRIVHFEIPNVGKVAYFKDPDGNVHGIIQDG